MADKELPQVIPTTSATASRTATPAAPEGTSTAAEPTEASAAESAAVPAGTPTAEATEASAPARSAGTAAAATPAATAASPASEAPPASVASLAAMADLATPMAIRVAATLRIVDHLPASAPELAATVDADADAIDRLLRHLVTAGVLTREVDSDQYAVTELGAGLRTDHPAGLAARLDVEGGLGHADLAFVRLLHSVRTGGPAYAEQYGTSFWAALSADPARAASFDEQMGAVVEADAPRIVSAYDWGALGHVVDVGGGNGTLLIAMLKEYPALRGTVVDLPGTAETARRRLAAAGVADRANAVAGDFFGELPTGAEGYLLCSVLHHWSDEEARAILRNCAAAAGEDGAVFVIEKVADTIDTERDLRGLVLFGGGRERDVGELTVLAESADLTVVAVHTAGAIAIVELAAM